MNLALAFNNVEYRTGKQGNQKLFPETKPPEKIPTDTLSMSL